MTDPAGNQWRLAPNGYWWLRRGDLWHQAGSQAAGDVRGVPVPGYNPAAFAAVMGEMNERLAQSFRQAGTVPTPRSADPLKAIRVKPGNVTAVAARREVPTVPNIPPDFLPVPPGPGCCTGCHLNDGPLFEGDLCRYCWMLANVDVDAPSAPVARPVVELTLAHPVRDAVLPLVKFFLALIALYYVLGLF